MFFRFGYFKYIKLNLFDMVLKYEPLRWYKFDFIFNWGKGTIAIYINDAYFSTQPFFYEDSSIPKANAIMLYNLAPGTKVYVKDLMVCEDRCTGGEELAYQGARRLVAGLLTLTVFFLLLV